jgi:hypothetical protein
MNPYWAQRRHTTLAKKNKHLPHGSFYFSTIHVPSGKPGRRFNAKENYRGHGAFAIGIKGRREGDGGKNPLEGYIPSWDRRT